MASIFGCLSRTYRLVTLPKEQLLILRVLLPFQIGESHVERTALATDQTSTACRSFLPNKLICLGLCLILIILHLNYHRQQEQQQHSDNHRWWKLSTSTSSLLLPQRSQRSERCSSSTAAAVTSTAVTKHADVDRITATQTATSVSTVAESIIVSNMYCTLSHRFHIVRMSPLTKV